jgi:hypothetical protein
MQLYMIVDGSVRTLDVPDDMRRDAGEFFAMMDRDMDGGWQMGPEWVEEPAVADRCRIVADKILAAMAGGRDDTARLLAAYILERAPEVVGVRVDTGGEMLSTDLLEEAEWKEHTRQLSPEEAASRAEREVANVYRVGRNYRFAVFDRSGGGWVESEPVADEADANRLRKAAVNQRSRELAAHIEWTGAP